MCVCACVCVCVHVCVCVCVCVEEVYIPLDMKHSSPLGELFDHGLDSWAAIMLPMCLYSGLGREEPWGGSPHEAFAPCLAGLAGFLLSHWEKYITGTLYLPWLYDAMQLVSLLVLEPSLPAMAV